jgi:hypothetical protein
MARPTKYKEEYCDVVKEVMGKGFSKEAVAGHIGISKDTLYNWVKKYKEFSDAIKKGVEASRVFWEELGIEMVTAGQGNSTAWIFNMKNRFNWRDKKETQLTGKDGEDLTLNIKVVDDKDAIKAMSKNGSSTGNQKLPEATEDL